MVSLELPKELSVPALAISAPDKNIAHTIARKQIPATHSMKEKRNTKK
jgi:hypothetical protein